MPDESTTTPVGEGSHALLARDVIGKEGAVVTRKVLMTPLAWMQGTTSLIGMLVAAAGYLPPVAGAITQEVIDIAVIVNALRVAVPPRVMSDY